MEEKLDPAIVAVLAKGINFVDNTQSMIAKEIKCSVEHVIHGLPATVAEENTGKPTVPFVEPSHLNPT